MFGIFRRIANAFSRFFTRGQLIRPEDVAYPLAVFKYKGNVVLLCMVRRHTVHSLCFMHSSDGVAFSLSRKHPRLMMPTGAEEKLEKCSDFRISRTPREFAMTYIRHTEKGNELITATSSNMFDWHVLDATKNISTPADIVPNYIYRRQHVLYFGGDAIHTAFSNRFERWDVSGQSATVSNRDTPMTVLNTTLTKQGVFVVYDTSHQEGEKTHMRVDAMLFSADNPQEMLWHSETPLWEDTIETGGLVTPIGAVTDHDTVLCYWNTPQSGFITMAIQHPLRTLGGLAKERVHIERTSENPVVSPKREHQWESEGVFNPAALYIDEKVHVVYRALGSNGASTFGYTASKDGVTFDERDEYPAYWARMPFEGIHTKPRGFSHLFGSGGGWGGCEDPKLTCIDERVYLTYVAHSGCWPPRTAIASIHKKDFINRQWHKWSTPALMSPPNVDSKSACLLPEKVRGKYVIFHRTWPDIIIDYVDDLDFTSDEKWLQPTAKIAVRPNAWDSHKISLGMPPIKTDEGWLAVYGAVDNKDFSRYKIGAMLLDLEHPEHVLHRTRSPIMIPEEWYEHDWKPNIIYPSGAVVIDGILFMYYGGGDKYICVATAQLDTFLSELKQEHDIPLTMKRVGVRA